MFDIAEPSITKVLFLLVLILPGIISTKVYNLKRPSDKSAAKEVVLEIFAFSAVNLALMFPLIILIGKMSNIWESWLIVVLCFFFTPIIWPLLLNKILNFCSRKGLILNNAQTAWDYFFSSRTGCWIIVHLKNGEKAGGRFSSKSYASAFPKYGHLYIEELWKLDEELNFVEQMPGSQGIILRPDDYDFVNVYVEKESL